MPGLEFRIGLAAHDFASALGAPRVLITRARRDSRSPTVASRFWLRLQAMTGGLARDTRLERLAAGARRSGERPSPPSARRRVRRDEQRPTMISVTAVDRLKADPFAFYAQAMLRLRPLDPVDADHSAAWKGTAVHKVLEQWLARGRLRSREAGRRGPGRLLDGRRDPSDAPRAVAAAPDRGDPLDRRAGAQPTAPPGAVRWRPRSTGEAEFDGVTLHGKADRIDRLADGSLAIVDYKTGKAPAQKAVEAGFALQLGLLGLIARGWGFRRGRGRARSA